MCVPLGITRHASPIWYDIKWPQVLMMICLVIIKPRYKQILVTKNNVDGCTM